MPNRALILFAHGARAESWKAPFERLRDMTQARMPDVPVSLAFLELMEPRLPAQVASLAALLGIDERDAPARTGRHTFARLLVVEWEDQAFALPVADLYGIVRYASKGLTPPAATINRGLERYLLGVTSREDMHIGVLDASLIGYQMTRLLR